MDKKAEKMSYGDLCREVFYLVGDDAIVVHQNSDILPGDALRWRRTAYATGRYGCNGRVSFYVAVGGGVGNKEVAVIEYDRLGKLNKMATWGINIK